MNLCDALESKRFYNGQMIIVQGDQANGMYFIESGVSFDTLFEPSTLPPKQSTNLKSIQMTKKRVKIVKQMEDGRVIDVAVLAKGDYFGELALINHKPRAASVYASE